MTSGLKVRPRPVFDKRMFEVCEIGCAPVDMQVVAAAAGPGTAYDWGAVSRGIPFLLAGRALPYQPIRGDRYTCTSFVAYACGLHPIGARQVNRFTTTADIEAALCGIGRPAP
ncbi:hypothetical protein ACQP0C_30900 [Nocardia sp. CA-129566]|uniref:hypothetical protein n=1 Tax=Nocardia sp. CA-129566 TaxID=3239976 RepID=UPI003D979E1B